jgi:hypothetical protein
VRVVIFSVKIAREIFIPGTLFGQNIALYKVTSTKSNKTTAMLLISAASYTHWMGCELVTEMTVLLTDSLSTADWKAFLRLSNIMADGSQQNECD